MMHVYIDDSGDGGMKFGAGSSSHLVMAAAVFDDPTQLEKLSERLDACRLTCGHRREFKFNKTNHAVKTAFFDHVQQVDFRIRAIVIPKATLHSPKLRSDPGALKSFAIRMLLTKHYNQINDAKVFVDGQETRGMGIPDSMYFQRMVNRETPGTISDVRFVDSAQNIGIQLADMIAGSIHRAYRTNKPCDHTYWDTVRHRSWQPRGSLWHFK